MASNRNNVETVLRTLFKRCVRCPNETPVCPACKAGEVCSQMSQSCTQCASNACVKISSSGVTNTGQNSSNNQGPSVGAIAGGVIGGVAFIAVLTYLVWRFVIKPRREQEHDEWEEEVPVGDEKRPLAIERQRGHRASTHTVASIASTVLTRASNIIQIAYIPGVTNRSEAGTPSHLVPPVPPIPAGALANSQPAGPYGHEDAHFFMPGDLRDSTYSGLSDNSEARSSFARQSITPSLARSSLASTIYRNDAVANPLPAQTILRGRAAVVSVKTSQNTSPVDTPGRGTPPVPALDYQRHGQRAANVQEPSSAAVERPTPSPTPSASYAVTPSPLTIIKGRAGRAVEARPLTEVSIASSSDTGASSHSRAQRIMRESSTFEDSSDEDEIDGADSHKRSQLSLLPHNRNMERTSRATDLEDMQAATQSPFSDANRRSTASSISEGGSLRKSPSAARRQLQTLGSVIEEATRRASEGPGHFRGSERRQPSPFSDENAL